MGRLLVISSIPVNSEVHSSDLGNQIHKQPSWSRWGPWPAQHSTVASLWWPIASDYDFSEQLVSSPNFDASPYPWSILSNLLG